MTRTIDQKNLQEDMKMSEMYHFIKDCNAFLPDRGFCPGTNILMHEGLIEDIGKNVTPPSDSEVFDAQGAWATPGLIDGHTHLGLKEAPFNDNDVNEKSNPVTPYAQVIDAINPFNEMFPRALLNGITTAMVVPGSANVFGGLGALIKTSGTSLDSMVVKHPAGMKMALGANPKNSHGKDNNVATRMGTAYTMRKVFIDALEYRKRRHRKDNDKDRPTKDIGLENVLAVLSGELQARIHCHRADDLMTALRIAEEFGFTPCLDHATEGYLVREELAERQIPCFLGPITGTPTKQETIKKTVLNAVELNRAGVKFAIVSDHSVEPSWYLPIYAGLAVREGLSEDDGLQAITNWPAEIMGVDDRLGRLAAGADADVVVWDRHPLFLGKPTKVYTTGQPVCRETLLNSYSYLQNII